MENKNKLAAILHFISGILFFISALIGKNYVFIPIGCLFVVLGIKYNKKKMMIKVINTFNKKWIMSIVCIYS